MFGRRRNNRGILWASLLGLGVSAAAYGIRRNSNRRWQDSVKNIMNNFRTRNTSTLLPLTEFSKELVPYKGTVKK